MVGYYSVIHPTAIIHGGVCLGRNSHVGAFCELGSEEGTLLEIGEGAIIRSHTVIYGGSEYGPGLETGHFTLLRSGNSVGENLRIGSYASLEGGAEIGDFVRIHGRYEQTQGRIGHFAHLYGGTYVTDQQRPPSDATTVDIATIDEGAVVSMGCLVLGPARVGKLAFVPAGLTVAGIVPDGHILRRDGTTKPLKTFWPERYGHHYPPDAQERLGRLVAKVTGR